MNLPKHSTLRTPPPPGEPGLLIRPRSRQLFLIAHDQEQAEELEALVRLVRAALDMRAESEVVA
jgi:hypothetical protein